MVCRILRKYDFVPKDNTDRFISFKKNVSCPGCTWKKFLEFVMVTAYLTDSLPEEGIFIKELDGGFLLGGTLDLEYRNGQLKQTGHTAVDDKTFAGETK